MMITRFLTVAAVMAAIFAVPGRAAAQEKFSVDKVVAVVGNSAVFYSDLREMTELVEQNILEYGNDTGQSARDQALELLLTRKLLYNQALIDSVTINEEYLHQMVREQTSAMIARAGSMSALEASEGMPMYEIEERVRKQGEEELYANSMRYTVVQNVRITPAEVERFFNKINKDELGTIPEQYVYSQITKYPSNSEGARQRARERLLEMRERILGGEKFDMLARMYSVDQSTAMKGGESEYIELDLLYKPFADALVMLQPGQVSEVIETPDGFHIVEKLDQRGTTYKYRQILLKPVFTDTELVESDLFLDSLARAIRADEITFEEAARKHSDDKYSKENGGLVTNHEAIEVQMGNNPNIGYSSTKFFRESLLRPDFYALSTLRQGEISGSYRSIDMRENQLSKIVRLEEIIPAHQANIKDDYQQLEQAALSAKQEEVFGRWLERKTESMYVMIDPEYRDAYLLDKGWIK